MDNGLKKYTAHGAKSPFADAKDRQAAYRRVFSEGEGARVLQDILSSAGFFKPYVPSSAKPDNNSQAIFDHGKKYVCYEILNQLTIKLKEAEWSDELTNYDNNPLVFGAD
jgi:hypothetical protein